MTRPPFLAALAGAALAACTVPAGMTGAPAVALVTSEAEVAACTPVMTYTRTPGVYGPVAGQQALEYARNALLADAAKDGATHVLFDEGGPNEPAYLVRARAWRC